MRCLKIFCIFAVMLVGFGAVSSRAEDFKCPAPAEQTGADVKGDIDGHAQAFLKLGGADLKGNVEKTTVDLFSKYPNADRVAIISSLLSTTCNLIKSSTSLSDIEKLNKWFEVFPLISAMLLPDKPSEIPIARPDGCPNFTSKTRVQSEYHSSPTVTVEVLFLDALPGCQIVTVDHRLLGYSQFSNLVD
jgi:hypothetical protein